VLRSFPGTFAYGCWPLYGLLLTFDCTAEEGAHTHTRVPVFFFLYMSSFLYFITATRSREHSLFPFIQIRRRVKLLLNSPLLFLNPSEKGRRG
jgi:hypothetical protein